MKTKKRHVWIAAVLLLPLAGCGPARLTTFSYRGISGNRLSSSPHEVYVTFTAEHKVKSLLPLYYISTRTSPYVLDVLVNSTTNQTGDVTVLNAVAEMPDGQRMALVEDSAPLTGALKTNPRHLQITYKSANPCVSYCSHTAESRAGARLPSAGER